MTIHLPLFDDVNRTDARYKQPNESVFGCLNRSARREIIEIRARLGSWFERFPIEVRDDLRGRFRGDDHAHLGAFIELLIHEVLMRLDCTLEVHPEISDKKSRPDFLAHHRDCSFYVEATVIDPSTSPFAPNSLEEDVVAKINELPSTHFCINMKVVGKLSRALSRNQVVPPFAKLLAAHNPDEVQRLIHEKGQIATPSEIIKCGTWSLEGQLLPIAPEKRGYNKSRRLVIGPARTEMVDSSTPVHRAVRKKARKYGRLDAPLVVATNVCDPFFDKTDEVEVLFGKEQITYFEERPDLPTKLVRKPDGVWIQGGSKPRYTRLAAVWMFRDIAPWNLGARNCLYANPFIGDMELPEILYRFPHARAHEERIGDLQYFEGENIGQLLSVGEDTQT